MSHDINHEKVAQKLTYQLANLQYRSVQLETLVEQLEEEVANLTQQIQTQSNSDVSGVSDA